jgi:hypothetical protein
MFTTKDISYGEELSFDYCSLTESEKEFDEAVCLCGTEYCKGRYLMLANDKKYQAIMRDHHTFVDRNFILFKAISQPTLSLLDQERLARNGLKNSCLGKAPAWLKKWASLVLEYLEFEEAKYPEYFSEPGVKLEDIKIDAELQKLS